MRVRDRHLARGTPSLQTVALPAMDWRAQDCGLYSGPVRGLDFARFGVSTDQGADLVVTKSTHTQRGI